MKGKKLCSDAIFNINILNCVKLSFPNSRMSQTTLRSEDFLGPIQTLSCNSYFYKTDKVFNKKFILTTA